MDRVDAFREVRERCVKTFLDVIVASILTERASWGYEIIANIHDELHMLFSPGAIYPILYSMEKQGLIRKNGQSRKMLFSLTRQGEQWLSEMLGASKYIPQLIMLFTIRGKDGTKPASEKGLPISAPAWKNLLQEAKTAPPHQ